jgi:pullulanase/glycogen debranching enzyme
MLLLFNGAPDPVEFTIPDHCQSPGWTVAVDTSLDELPEKPRASGLKTTVEGRSIVVLVRPPFEDAEG